jgi:hypothetical protein
MSHIPLSHVERLPGDVRYCPKCGQANSSPARYCATCGISMTATAAEIDRPGDDQAESPPADADVSSPPRRLGAHFRRLLSPRR